MTVTSYVEKARGASVVTILKRNIFDVNKKDRLKTKRLPIHAALEDTLTHEIPPSTDFHTSLKSKTGEDHPPIIRMDPSRRTTALW